MFGSKCNSIVLSYATALFSVALSKLDAVRQDSDFLLEIFKEYRDIFVYLSNPLISNMHKKEVMLCVGKYIDGDLVKFIIIVLINGRFCLVLPILEKFIAFVMKKNNDLEVTVKSATILSKSELKVVIESLGMLGNITNVKNVQENSILGGFIVEYDSYIIDSSLKTYLENMVSLSKSAISDYNAREFV